MRMRVRMRHDRDRSRERATWSWRWRWSPGRKSITRGSETRTVDWNFQLKTIALLPASYDVLARPHRSGHVGIPSRLGKFPNSSVLIIYCLYDCCGQPYCLGAERARARARVPVQNEGHSPRRKRVRWAKSSREKTSKATVVSRAGFAAGN